MNNKPYSVVLTVITVFLFTFIWTFANYAQGQTNVRDKERKARLFEAHMNPLAGSIDRMHKIGIDIKGLGDKTSADSYKRIIEGERALQEGLRIQTDRIMSEANAAREKALEEIKKGRSLDQLWSKEEPSAEKEDIQNQQASTGSSSIINGNLASPHNRSESGNITVPQSKLGSGNLTVPQNEPKNGNLAAPQSKPEPSKPNGYGFVTPESGSFSTVVISSGRNASQSGMTGVDDQKGQRTSSSQQTGSNLLPSDMPKEESISEEERYNNRNERPLLLTVEEPKQREYLKGWKFPTPLDIHHILNEPENYAESYKEIKEHWIKTKQDFDTEHKDLIERKNEKLEDCYFSIAHVGADVATGVAGAMLTGGAGAAMAAPAFVVDADIAWYNCREANRLSKQYQHELQEYYYDARMDKVNGGDCRFNYTTRDEQKCLSLPDVSNFGRNSSNSN